MNVPEKIEHLIEEAFQPEYFLLQDDSAKHAGHAGARESGGGHYGVFIVSVKFENQPLVKRHRMVYDALKEIKGDIHALAIKALTPAEFEQNQ